MPTYEYACEHCGIFEVFQSMSEDALKKCPLCGSKKVQRLISGGAGVIFKGDGFWETDYNRSDEYKKQSKDDGGSTEKKTDGSSEKPQPKAQGAPEKQSQQTKKPKKKSDSD